MSALLPPPTAYPPYCFPTHQSCECLKDVVARVLPYWHDEIVPDLRANKRVMVAAHGNSLRALVKHLDKISDNDIASLNIPTAVPYVLELDDDLQKVQAE